MAKFNRLKETDINFCLMAVSSVVFKVRYRHLSNTESIILWGCLQGKSYEAIAEDYCYNLGHCCAVARDVFKLLSGRFNEPISKGNFVWFCERTFLIKSDQVLDDFCYNKISPERTANSLRAFKQLKGY